MAAKLSFIAHGLTMNRSGLSPALAGSYADGSAGNRLVRGPLANW